MINSDAVTNENIQEYHPNWPEISGYSYRLSIAEGSGSGKANSLFNLKSLNAKDLYEAKYQFLINKQESKGTKHFNDSKAFIEYSSNMDNIYKTIGEYNPKKTVKY